MIDRRLWLDEAGQHHRLVVAVIEAANSTLVGCHRPVAGYHAAIDILGEKTAENLILVLRSE